MLRLLRLLPLVLLVFLLAPEISAQQDANDLGEADSVLADIYRPQAGTNDSLINVDLYLFNDVQDLRSVQVLLEWDNEAMVFDSLRWTNWAEFAFYPPAIFDPVDPDMVNLYRQIPFVGLHSEGPGLQAGDEAKHMATFFFHVEAWNEGDSVCIDDITGQPNIFSDFSLNDYYPIWMGQSCFDLSSEPTAVWESEVVNLPVSFHLRQNYPNPFNPATTITFDLARRQTVELTVLNLSGRKVATLIEGPLGPGDHQISWDATDTHGNRVASGIYLYRLTTEDGAQTRKMVLLK